MLQLKQEWILLKLSGKKISMLLSLYYKYYESIQWLKSIHSVQLCICTVCLLTGCNNTLMMASRCTGGQIKVKCKEAKSHVGQNPHMTKYQVHFLSRSGGQSLGAGPSPSIKGRHWAQTSCRPVVTRFSTWWNNLSVVVTTRAAHRRFNTACAVAATALRHLHLLLLHLHHHHHHQTVDEFEDLRHCVAVGISKACRTWRSGRVDLLHWLLTPRIIASAVTEEVVFGWQYFVTIYVILFYLTGVFTASTTTLNMRCFFSLGRFLLCCTSSVFSGG